MPTLKCPRCSTKFSAAPVAGGHVVCSKCGARLKAPANKPSPRAKQSPLDEAQGFEIDSLLSSINAKESPADTKPPGVLQPVSEEPTAAPAHEEPFKSASDENPAATLPPGTKHKPVPRPAHWPPRSEPGAERVALPATPAPARAATSEPDPTPHAGDLARAPAADRHAPAALDANAAALQATLNDILAEIRALRRMQEQVLALVGSGAPPFSPATTSDEGYFTVEEVTEADAEDASSLAALVRSPRRKSVLLIDDDPRTRSASASALERAQIPVRTATDGNGGLAAIASEKPDVIVLELDIDGEMAGKDVINMIKATMEWVDIPIVLHTRAPIASQKEARTLHGGDEFVLKGGGSEDALVAKVVMLFRSRS